MIEMIRGFFDWLFTWRKMLGKALIIFIIFFVAFNGLFFVSANYPKSCLVCHFMEPYYEQWKTSGHSGVTCIKCHSFRPLFITVTTLKYMTGLYNTRPHGEVENSACTSRECHSRRISRPRAYLEGKVLFNHKEHMTKMMRGESLRCTSCHYQMVQGKHISVDKRVCFLCHFKGMSQGQSVGGCSFCHPKLKKTVQRKGFHFSHDSYLKLGVTCRQCHIRVAEGDGAVGEKKCFSCHVAKDRSKYDRVTLHRIHITLNGIECLKCHEPIKHREVEMVKVFEVRCQTCHKRLHGNQKEMYMGTGARGVPDTPSRMFSAQVACDGCHTQSVQELESGIPVSGERKLLAERKSCVTCHGKGYDRMLDNWLRESRDLERMIKKVVSEGERDISKRGKEGISREIGEIMEDIRVNYEFLSSGRGAHNIEYAWKIVRTAYSQVNLLKKLLKEQPLARPGLISSDSGYCTKFCHGRLGIPDEVYFGEMELTFPHKKHIEDVEIDCTACHSPDNHKMRIVSKGECMSCHHGGENMECGDCHGSQAALYRGTFKIEGVQVEGDPMYEGGIECMGCHDLSGKTPQTIVEIQKKCAECHEDEEYGKMALQWEKELLSIENRVTVDMEDASNRIRRMKRLGRETESMERKLEETRKIYNHVTKGRGIHNHTLSMSLLEQAAKELRKILGKE